MGMGPELERHLQDRRARAHQIHSDWVGQRTRPQELAHGEVEAPELREGGQSLESTEASGQR